jgi:arylsulfatase A-like enzyme
MSLLITAALMAAVQPATVDAPPNILFLFADDQRADTIAAHGNEHIVTPALDALAARGFSFRNNYCMGATQGAVCVASRAMLMTGRALYRADGALEQYPSLPRVFSDAGYRVYATGKWHNGAKSFTALFDEGAELFFGGMSDHTKVPVRDKPRGGDLTEPRPGGKFSSELFADAAIDFLREERDEDRPFFLYVSFTAPHDPRQPPQVWRDHYYENRPPLPANFMGLHPFHNGWMRGRDEQLAAWPRTKAVVSDQLAEYYGMISHLDEQVGRILAALESTGAAENTIVVYTADHGLAMGSHGLLGKQSVYEHSMKSPLIIAGPGVPQGESAALTYLFDLYPTLCSAAGLEAPEGLDGADLLPLVRGTESSVRTQLVTSFEDKMRGIRDERWKLIRYPLLHHTQLFDLDADPDELTNLAELDEHAERVERMLLDLSRWQVRFEDPHPLTVDPEQPMDYDPSGWRRKSDPWQPQWIREKYFGE